MHNSISPLNGSISACSGLGSQRSKAGIAKAGAGWLPFDADTPVERISVCLEDANAVGIVSCN
jgi:hypothetical protein